MKLRRSPNGYVIGDGRVLRCTKGPWYSTENLPCQECEVMVAWTARRNDFEFLRSKMTALMCEYGCESIFHEDTVCVACDVRLNVTAPWFLCMVAVSYSVQ